MKDWTPITWITYACYGVMALLWAINTAIKENSPLSAWLPPFFKVYILGYGPFIFFLILTIFLIIQMGRSRKSTEAGNATNRPVSAPVLSSTHSLVRPKKFYSERNREE